MSPFGVLEWVPDYLLCSLETIVRLVRQERYVQKDLSLEWWLTCLCRNANLDGWSWCCGKNNNSVSPPTLTKVFMKRITISLLASISVLSCYVDCVLMLYLYRYKLKLGEIGKSPFPPLSFFGILLFWIKFANLSS